MTTGMPAARAAWVSLRESPTISTSAGVSVRRRQASSSWPGSGLRTGSESPPMEKAKNGASPNCTSSGSM